MRVELGSEYTPGELIATLQYRKKKGLSIHAREIKRENSRFYREVIDCFGSWKNFLSEAGYNYQKEYGRKHYGYWTKEKVQEHLRERLDSGKGISCSELQAEDMKLYEASVNMYGSWELAVESLGLDSRRYRKVRGAKYWNRETILQEVSGLIMEGKDVRPSDIYHNIGLTLGTVEVYFGSWSVLYRELGLSEKDIRNKKRGVEWTKEDVLSEIRYRLSKGKSVRASEVSSDEPKLYRVGLSHFGSWKELLENVEVG